MYRYRGFLVWLLGNVVILSLFLPFYFKGWPGKPNDCIHKTPNTCFCEKFDQEAVESNAPGARQPVNTWSNLYSFFTSFLVAIIVFIDRRKTGSGVASNLMCSNTAVPDLYIFAVLFLGYGSMFLHASLTAWGGVIDAFSMYVFTAIPIFYSLRRLKKSALLFWVGYSFTVAMFTLMHALKITSLFLIMSLIGVYLIIEIIIWIKSHKVLQGKKWPILFWSLACGFMVIGSVFWGLSQTGGRLCNPDSVFQPHGFIWHPCAGLTALFLYFYWRLADDRAI